MALENEWGGSSSREKALALLQKVEDGMCAASHVHADELEDLLDLALLDDFNVEAEDESPKQVAQLLSKIHYEARNGGDETARSLIERASAQGKKTWVQGALQVKRAADSSDEEDFGEGDSAMTDHAMDVERSEASNAWIPPAVDEDGFQMVTKGSRGRNNRGGARQESA